MENGPVSQQQADILDAWRSGQFNLWAQLEPLVEAAITKQLATKRAAPGIVSSVDGHEQIKRLVELTSASPTENGWAQLEPLVNAVITRRLIAFHAALLRGGEIPEMRPAKVDDSEDDLRKEALKRLAEVWFPMGMKQCP